MKRSAITFLMLIGFVFNTASAFAQKEKILLKSVVLDQEGAGVYKHYSYDKPLDIEYSYGENIMDGEWSNVLRLTISENKSGDLLVPTDIEKAGFIVGGDGDSTMKQFKLPDAQLPEYCNLVGSAKVLLDDMLIWVPEISSSYESSAKVVDVLTVSKPKLICPE